MAARKCVCVCVCVGGGSGCRVCVCVGGGGGGGGVGVSGCRGVKISLSVRYFWKAMAMTIRYRNIIKMHKTEQFASQASLPDVKVGHKYTNCAGSRIGVANIAYRAGY